MAQTISPEYLQQQRDLHQNPNYGNASLTFAPLVKDLITQFNVRSVSDYGAGKQKLLRGLHELGLTDFDYFPYDPAFPEYGEPKPADLVCCIDVLEHIELAFLDAVLAELQTITIGRGFFSVHCGPAVKFLSDGRNAHLIQQPPSWWLPKLRQYFHVRQFETTPNGFWVLTERREGAATRATSGQ